jgi:predicted metalloendopeptidase
LAPALATIRNLKDKRAVAALMGKQDLQGAPSIFALGISQDAKAPNKYAVLLATGGLGLPDRDYYLKDSFAVKKAKYVVYAREMLDRIGWKDAPTAAQVPYLGDASGSLSAAQDAPAHPNSAAVSRTFSFFITISPNPLAKG